MRTAAIVNATLALAVLGTGVAHSDPNEVTGTDVQYLKALASQGITDGSGTSQHSMQTLIGIGQGVCQELDQGKTPVQIAYEIADTASINPSDPLGIPDNAAFLVAAAVAKYCPQYRPMIR